MDGSNSSLDLRILRCEAHGSSSPWHTVGRTIKHFHISLTFQRSGSMVGALKSCCIYTVWVFPEQFKGCACIIYQWGSRLSQSYTLLLQIVILFVENPSLSILGVACYSFYIMKFGEVGPVLEALVSIGRPLLMHPWAFFFPDLNTLIFSLFNVFRKTTEDETHLRISLIAFQIPLPDSSVTDFLRSRDLKIDTFLSKTCMREDLVWLTIFLLASSAFLPLRPCHQVSD